MGVARNGPWGEGEGLAMEREGSAFFALQGFSEEHSGVTDCWAMRALGGGDERMGAWR